MPTMNTVFDSNIPQVGDTVELLPYRGHELSEGLYEVEGVVDLVSLTTGTTPKIGSDLLIQIRYRSLDDGSTLFVTYNAFAGRHWINSSAISRNTLQINSKDIQSSVHIFDAISDVVEERVYGE